ncbi:hypothetical protein P7C70_g5024, partial [Phenoliferia sp. Uapishka_3]
MSGPHAGMTHLESSTSFEGSNISLLGSNVSVIVIAPPLRFQAEAHTTSPQIDHQLKSISAHTEPAWSAPGLGSKPGIWSWVVQDFKLVPFKTGDLGSGELHEGDSYIICRSVAPVASKPDVLIHDIFFWLGSKTSQDEAGVAAYKSVELDEFLGRSPTQHREVQSLESSTFLSLFHPHLVITLGGNASGFHHVDHAASIHLSSPRLWKISQPDKKHVKVQEVKAEAESIDRGDVFILDLGDKLLQWNGGKSAPMEKAKAAETARSWVDARDGKATLQVFDDGQGDSAFFLALGVPQNSLPFTPATNAIQIPPQSSQATSTSTCISLLSSDSSASATPTSFSRSHLSPPSLKLVIPARPPPIPAYIWVGSEVPMEETRFAFVRAQKFVHGRGLIAVKEGREGEGFERDV